MNSVIRIVLAFMFCFAIESTTELADAKKGYKRPRDRNTPSTTVSKPRGPVGPRKSVAVWPVPGPKYTFPGVEELVVHELVNSNDYIVVERLNIPALNAEAELADKVKHVGAQLIFEVAVTDIDQRSSRGISIGFGEQNIGNGFDVVLGATRTSAHADIVLRVIETQTGKILSSQTARGTSVGLGLDLGFAYNNIKAGGVDGLGINTSKWQSTSVGKAVSRAVDIAVAKTTGKLRSVKWEARVAEVDDQFVYINAGSKEGMKQGMVLTISRPGKTITDPVNGAVLDVVFIPLAKVQIMSVKDRIAITQVIEYMTENEGIQRGDLVHLTKE